MIVSFNNFQYYFDKKCVRIVCEGYLQLQANVR